MRGLAGRAFVVTGGASGIGRATCERLSAEGAAVAIVDRNQELAAEVAGELAGRRGQAIAIAVDVSREEEAWAAIERAARELGPLAGVVTSAGIFDPGDMQLAADVSVATFERTLAVNLLGTFLFVKHVIPHLLTPRADGGAGGSIVTIASTAGLRGHGFGAGYTASKGGVVALTRLVAFQYGERGIRANCVCPGLTNTPMVGGAYDDPEAARRVTRGIPLRRIARAEEVGQLACYLLSDDASYVNGQVIAADGGATVV
ncbi:MAG TPA: SDR family NAD(P)-dependent oxidoreductase [Candidatus Binatia bacterium]|nr:SDR family NAD(P)-dependent oxidoreductase [Candidatus Binatia bacterium]